MVSTVSQPEQVPLKPDQLLKKKEQPDMADASPGTPPAEKPTLSPPPPDTPCESTTPTSTSSDGAETSTENTNTSSASASEQTISAKPAKDVSLNAQAAAFVPNVAAAPFVPASLSAVNSHRHQNGAAGQMHNGASPTASNTASPHAAWDAAEYGDAGSYENGYGGYENYGAYANGYAGYSYSAGYCMTSDGLFVPQQVGSASTKHAAALLATSICCNALRDLVHDELYAYRLN